MVFFLRIGRKYVFPPIPALALAIFKSLNLNEQFKTKIGCDFLRLLEIFDFEAVRDGA